MATKEQIIAKAKEAILDFDEDVAAGVAQEYLDAGINTVELIKDGFTGAMTSRRTVRGRYTFPSSCDSIIRGYERRCGWTYT
ncbi:B12-binding domain-containing protein [Methanolobus sp.]|uniref:B12-binding domain-containing protein n=1 Tax=Methanolobus sp. TaxID=1874737 RepID=UPI003522E22C